jgi:DNA-binding XRE family transcriptional regulator
VSVVDRLAASMSTLRLAVEEKRSVVLEGRHLPHWSVAIDIRPVLHRVVDEVFDESTFVKECDDHEAPRTYRVRLSIRGTSHDQGRHASLVATSERFQAHILDLGVGTIRFDYDDDEAEKEADLRDLALLVRTYLQGAGEVTYRPSLLRRRPTPR